MTATASRTSDHASSPERANVSGTPEQRLAIEVEDLIKVYPGGKTALAGVSFSVDRGEIFGFLGPNGSGKTTAVRILVTLLRKTSGIARVGGLDVEAQAGRVRDSIGFAGQSVGVDDDLTAVENLTLGGVLHGRSYSAARQRAGEMLGIFSLADVAGVRAARLSGGMRRRLDLAQAMVHGPTVVFLDEPTTGLDPQSRKALWELLRHLSENGTTVFLTTQYLEEADRACDRVAILDDGRLVKVGTPRNLKQEVGGGRLTLTIREDPDRTLAVQVLASIPNVTRVQPGRKGEPLVVYVDDPSTSAPLVLSLLQAEGIDVASLEQAQASLDDVFLRYTGERPRVEAGVEGAVSTGFASAHGRRRPH
jgi:ABC-2 type transport system ATP-binding protein